MGEGEDLVGVGRGVEGHVADVELPFEGLCLENKPRNRDWDFLPTKIHSIIAEKLDGKSRSQFRLTSRQCNKEIITSSKFKNSLKLFSFNPEYAFFKVEYGAGSGYGTLWDFKSDESGRKFFRVYTLDKKLKYEEELFVNVSVVFVALIYFRKVMRSHQYRMEELVVHGDVFSRNWANPLLDLGDIENLSCLKSLKVDLIDVRTLLSLVDHDLDTLCTGAEQTCLDAPLYNHTYKVRHLLHLPHMSMNYAQFKRLKAANVYLHIGQLTTSNIFNFLKEWRSGKVRETFRSARWLLEYWHERFNLFKLYARCGAYYPEGKRGMRLVIERKDGLLGILETNQTNMELQFYVHGRRRRNSNRIPLK